MKKLLMSVLVGLAMGSSSALANVSLSIDFRNVTGNSVFSDAAETIRAPVGTWCAQLIWSSDAIADPFTDPTHPLTSLAVGEVQLALLTPSASAGRILSSDYTAAGFGTASTTQPYSTASDGYVYARLFNSVTPTVGSMYTQVAISGGMAEAPTVNTYQYSNSYFNTSIVAVPEPGTFGLALIGLGLIALRRRLHS